MTKSSAWVRPCESGPKIYEVLEQFGEIGSRIDFVEFDGCMASAACIKLPTAAESATAKRPLMMDEITTIGLDIPKRIFVVHGADSAGNGLLRKKLRREEVHAFVASLAPCLVSKEVCTPAQNTTLC